MAVISPALGVNQHRALLDLARRGTARAAVGLTEMVGRDIRITALDVSLMKIQHVPGLLNHPEEPVVGIYLGICGEVKGHILLLFSPKEARGLVDMLMGDPPGSSTTIDEMARSALAEVGNLTGAFFLAILEEQTDLNSKPSPPAVMEDMGAAVLDGPLVCLAESSDDALVINTLFTDNDREIEAVFLVMPDMESLKAILGVLEKRWSNN